MSVLAITPIAGAATSAAPPDTTRFDLAAQPLEAALAAYSRLTGLSVLVSSTLTDGKQAAAVHGDFGPREALRQLLAGTQLDVRYTSPTAFTLMPVLNSVQPDTSAADAPTPPVARRFTGSPYSAVIQRGVTRALCQAQPEAFGHYRIGLQLWIDGGGEVRDARVLESSGMPQRDSDVLGQMQGLMLDASPPAGLPQPVTILLAPRPNPTADCRPFLSGGG